MLKILRQRFLRFFRHLLGTGQILQQEQWVSQYQQKALLTFGNALKYSSTDPEKVEMTVANKRCAEIVSLLSPMDVKGEKYIRVGKDYDGGYIMLDDFQKKKTDAAYSLGIGQDVSWDEAIANRGIDVFMFDHTIDRLPKYHSKFHYFKTGVTGHKKGANLKTLGELIIENGHTMCKNLIMKIDVEGCEWDIFQEAESSVIGQFSQIIVEFHELTFTAYNQNYLPIVNVLKKINQTHQSIHVHANNINLPLWIGKLVLPTELEVTYIRRTEVKDKLVANTRQFPTEIDQPTLPLWPDIYLGSFSND
jgi:hypothetical protein